MPEKMLKKTGQARKMEFSLQPKFMWIKGSHWKPQSVGLVLNQIREPSRLFIASRLAATTRVEENGKIQALDEKRDRYTCVF